MFEPYILYLGPKILVNQKKNVIKFFRNNVYGLGFLRSTRFCIFLGSSKNLNINVIKLNTRYLQRFQGFSFKSGYALGTYLKKRRISVRKFSIKIKIRKGLRQYYGLPSRGQRSHSNAATAKKKLNSGIIMSQQKRRF
jgi:ribosomal protein S13